MPQARLAQTQDAPVLTELLEIAKQEMLADKRGGKMYLQTEVRQDFSTLESELVNTNQCHLVGVYEDAVVGWGFATIEQISEGPKVGKVRELFVHPQARGIGVGEAILGELIEWAQQNQCDGVEGTALPGNRNFKGIFERFGMKSRMLTVYKEL